MIESILVVVFFLATFLLLLSIAIERLWVCMVAVGLMFGFMATVLIKTEYDTKQDKSNCLEAGGTTIIEGKCYNLGAGIQLP